ncbi:MAG: hypothetical protein KDA74_09920, partial [Planctomycetaceae bacterium]|nr:hypothetical protein [Planctomycetaceae bacterium]
FVTDGGDDHLLETTEDNRSIELAFDVTLNAQNDDPELDPLTDLLLPRNEFEQTVNLSGITAGGGESQPLRVTAQSSNTGLIANPVVNYTSADNTGSLIFTPITDQTGTTTITVTVEDGGLDGNLETPEDNASITRTFEVTVREMETLSLRVVETPTATDEQGTVMALPPNQDSISEWKDYWVEIWVSTEDLASQGIASVFLDLSYQTAFTTATGFEFGDAFSLNQTGTIDDVTGLVDNLSASTAVADLGLTGNLLFARIHFESLADDQVLLDFEQQSIGPYDLSLQVLSREFSLVNGRTSTAPVVDVSAAEIYANPLDLNDDGLLNYRDLILLVSVYGVVPSESVSDYAWAADLDQNDLVNYRDLIALVTNYGKSKSEAQEIKYPVNYPDAWNRSLLVTTGFSKTQSKVPALKQSQAEDLLQAAVAEMSTGLLPEDQEKLASVKIEVVDLSGTTLGKATADTIYVD